MNKRTPTVVLVGRQNVGKSTLLNTLTGRRTAIVSPVPGTTRDRTTGTATWRGNNWTIVDTGGIEAQPADALTAAVRKHAERAMERADCVCFVVDGQAGLTGEDRAAAALLRNLRKPVLLVVNKMDGPRQRERVDPAIYTLGFPEILFLSAKNGVGVGDLLECIAAHLPRGTNQDSTEEIRLAIIGQPNVGKSSLLNRILGEERVLVTPHPHTTRDAQDVLFTFAGQRFQLIDTAGMHRRGMQHMRATSAAGEEQIAHASLRMAMTALSRADVAVVVLDATQPVTRQDRSILRYVADAKTGALLAVNKWDLIPGKTTSTLQQVERRVRTALPFVPWAPLLFVSARTGQRVFDLLRTAQRIAEARGKKISAPALDHFLDTVVRPRWPERTKGGARPRTFFSLRQTETAPPTFRVLIGPKQKLLSAHERFIENALRTHFQLLGTPIQLLVEQKRR